MRDAEVGKKQVLGTPRLYLKKNPEGSCGISTAIPAPGKATKEPHHRNRGRQARYHTQQGGGKAKLCRVIARWYRPSGRQALKAPEEMTFGRLADQWIGDNKHRWGEKRLSEANHLLHVYGKKLTNLRMAQIQPEIVRDTLKPFVKTHQFHRAREMFMQIIDYAKALRMYAGPNAADWKILKHLFPGYSAPARGHFTAMPGERVPVFFQH